jgi:hypothetical protein
VAWFWLLWKGNLLTMIFPFNTPHYSRLYLDEVAGFRHLTPTSCLDWTRNGSYLYQLFPTKLSAGQASAKCNGLGAELASIMSSGENAFLKAQLGPEGFNQVGRAENDRD